MNNFPFGYEPIAQTTWVYLSSLLMLGLFFKFNRFWSIRNLDLILIILLAPGLLMIYYGTQWRQDALQRVLGQAAVAGPGQVATEPEEPAAVPQQPDSQAILADPAARSGDLSVEQREAIRLERRGYLWLFGIGVLWLVRMLCDPLMRRRPMLEPNLVIGGLAFLGCSFMVFLFANVAASQPVAEDLHGARSAEDIVRGEGSRAPTELRRRGPGYALFHLLPILPTFVNERPMVRADGQQSTADPVFDSRHVIAAKAVAIVAQIALVSGLIFVGRWHFGSYAVGMGMATIYLMLPYTAQMTGRVMHILPAALLVWAVALYRRPGYAGVFTGLAAGVAYYPLFLLPLWMSFYWERGVWRFVIGFVGSLSLVVASLAFTSADLQHFVAQVQQMFGFWFPLTEGLEGIWALGWDPWFRLPVLVAFVALCVTFAFWPAVKNLGSLMALTSAVMIAVQFWHGFGGGLYMAWYLPFALMVIFRPNLEDRTAEQTVLPSRWPWRTGAGRPSISLR